MVMRMELYCRTRFVAYHKWKDAPDEYKYLSNIHRHEFHVEIAIRVETSNRAVEFQHLKNDVDQLIKREWYYSINSTQSNPVPIEASCELMAAQLASHLREYAYNVTMVDVSEDGECGGRVTYNV